MKRKLFEQLTKSLHEAGKISRNEMQASRKFRFNKIDTKAIRLKNGLTQTEFAMMIGVSPRTLQNWEQGHRKPEGPALALLTIVPADAATGVVVAANVVITFNNKIVDNSIVIIDNHVEKVDHRYSPWHAAIASAKELFIPTVTATLAIMVTYIPLGLMVPGTAGEFLETIPIISSIVEKSFIGIPLDCKTTLAPLKTSLAIV